VHARIARIVIGTMDPRTGAAGSVFNLLDSGQLNHRVEVTRGVMQEQCAKLLRGFFVEKRKRNGSKS
jgi:tRNA(adenine34) deaminase